MHVSPKTFGFTLVELIAGIVVFAIALTLVTALVASQSRQSIDPIWQVRATELGQSLLNEISAKAFDENSDFVGGSTRCNESTACTSSSALGPDAGESREDFDDVDDFNGLDATGGAITNSLNETLQGPGGNLYEGFRLQVAVFYDDNLDGINDDDVNQDGSLDSGTYVGNRKLIQIRVTTPGGDSIQFSLYKVNY
ncbi:type IV pilus modification PilV family protein [Alteromonas flava]|uniref:type IV pilus modification PilV family protein n=1 Tax=Alteromonas flava TaxID=2048003 RepID=UPI000C281EAD|nr:prepilin-type N-terminal cleavage/methylation domain-containing protein [Alteromonas flava]